MAETTTAETTPEPEVVEVPHVVGVAVSIGTEHGPRVIQHDYGIDWDIADGYLRVLGRQTGGGTRDIAEYAPHNWEHVSFVFQGDD